MAHSGPNHLSDPSGSTADLSPGIGGIHRRNRARRSSSNPLSRSANPSKERSSRSKARDNPQYTRLSQLNDEAFQLHLSDNDKQTKKRRGHPRRRRQRTYPSPEQLYYSHSLQSPYRLPHYSYFPQPLASPFPTDLPYYGPYLSPFPPTTAIAPNPQSNAPSKYVQLYKSSAEEYRFRTDTPDEEKTKVHHVVNISPQALHADEHGESIKNAFPRHPTFNHQDKKTLSAKYEIVQTRLIPALENGASGVAVLTFEDEAPISRSEIRWM